VVHEKGRERKELMMRASRLTAASGQAYEAIVTAMSRTFEALSREITATLLSLAQQPPALMVFATASTAWRVLISSSFTVAHSLTLAVATLGYASAPLPPLNAAIALSILFLGPEIIRAGRGDTSLTPRHPWVVAFAFGLLHGFGFASGVTSMGLPHTEIPRALLLFNLGVEAGQMLFVWLIVLLARAFQTLNIRWPPWVEAVPAYAVGTLGAYWTMQRTVLLLVGGP
jgi:hypothetical protein